MVRSIDSENFLESFKLKRQRLISEQGAHLGDKPDGEGKEDLKQKHAELAKKVLEVRNKVHNAETEVKTLQKEILDAGLKLLHNNIGLLIKNHSRNLQDLVLPRFLC